MPNVLSVLNVLDLKLMKILSDGDYYYSLFPVEDIDFGVPKVIFSYFGKLVNVADFRLQHGNLPPEIWLLTLSII